MEIISLSKDPNQRFTLHRDGFIFDIFLRTLSTGIVLATVSIDGVQRCSGIRVINGQWLIPYDYLVQGSGNLRFETASSETYPAYDEYDEETQLVYYSNEEYQSMIG